MTGTIINVFAVIAGGCIGLCIKKGLPERINQAVTYMLGLSSGVIGLNGLLGTMVTVDTATGRLSSSGELLLLGSLALGALIGELLRIQERLERAGELVEKRLGASHFSKGFISASVLIASIVLGASLGIGVPCAALTVLVYQGALTLLAGSLKDVLAGALMDQICMVGYAIVICIGINFFGVVKIKTASLLPALLGPVLWNVTMWLKTLWV